MGATVRPARADELPLFARWAAAEGWNPGRDDWRAGVAGTAPGAFLVAVSEEAGQVVGTVATMAYGPTYVFAGYFIVQAAWRARGVGRLLSEAALRAALAAGTATVAADAAVAQVERYGRWGGLVVSHPVVRYAGRPILAAASAVVPPAADAVHVVPVSEVPLAALQALDERYLGTGPLPPDAAAQRAAFLAAWTARPPPTHTLCLVSGGTGDAGAVVGLGTVRPAERGYRVGPLYAPSADAASVLLAALVKAVATSTLERPDDVEVAVDVPEAADNQGAVAWARDTLGLTEAFRCVRMYRDGANGTRPPTAHVYGTFTLEFGP
jgi:GNAT superfamily N-acetyltransferase